MKKIYSVICSKYRKFKNPKIYNILYDDMREEIQKLKVLTSSSKIFCLFIKKRYRFVWSVETIQKVKPQKLQAQKWQNNYFIKMGSER